MMAAEGLEAWRGKDIEVGTQDLEKKNSLGRDLRTHMSSSQGKDPEYPRRKCPVKGPKARESNSLGGDPSTHEQKTLR